MGLNLISACCLPQRRLASHWEENLRSLLHTCNEYTNTNGVFHKLPTIQECQYCQHPLRQDIRNELDQWGFPPWKVILLYSLISLCGADKEGNNGNIANFVCLWKTRTGFWELCRHSLFLFFYVFLWAENCMTNYIGHEANMIYDESQIFNNFPSVVAEICRLSPFFIPF